MSTPAQISANQLNAQLSTGPRTSEGKAASSHNATRHGLTATYPVIRSADEQTQFDDLTAAYLHELQPDTPTEKTIFNNLLLAAWNIDRCHRLEAELSANSAVDPLLDEALAKSLARIETYRQRAERLFHKSLQLLTATPKPKRKPVYSSSGEQNEPKRYTFTPQGSPYIRHNPKVGRNEPCPCGSTRKYKQCCLPNKPNSHAA